MSGDLIVRAENELKANLGEEADEFCNQLNEESSDEQWIIPQGVMSSDNEQWKVRT